MTDEEIADEWYRLAGMKCADMSEDDTARLIAIDREAFNRKYNVRKRALGDTENGL